MNYRINSKNGDRLSILGYGCMRFPTKGNAIDETEAQRQLLAAIEGGVNYLDTAWIYHGGKSESLLGRVLSQDGLRDRVKIATKLPTYLVRRASDIDRYFDAQLERLQTDRIDYYLMHILSDVGAWERLKALGIVEWIARKKQAGQIVNLGFSYHGSKAEFRALVDAYDWDFVQIQYNYLDENNQAGKEGLLYAAGNGLPVIVMEPLRGGKIVNSLPKEVTSLWEQAKPAKRSAAEWALRWVWNHPQVLLLLSGMSTMEQVQENLRVASEAQAGEMTAEQLEYFDKARRVLSEKTRVPCTGCGYCMPCPAGVDIPTCFTCYNIKNNGSFKPRFNYLRDTGAWASSPGVASRCVQCGKCESHCPQHIRIRDELKNTARDMEGPLSRTIVALMKRFMG